MLIKTQKGLFGVKIPVIYGEGEASAFYRLQIEIFRFTGDLSIFAWKGEQTNKLDTRYIPALRPTLFSPSVRLFRSSQRDSCPPPTGYRLDGMNSSHLRFDNPSSHVPRMFEHYERVWGKVDRQSRNIQHILIFPAGLRLLLALVPLDMNGQVGKSKSAVDTAIYYFVLLLV